jgi:hypothetical protein
VPVIVATSRLLVVLSRTSASTEILAGVLLGSWVDGVCASKVSRRVACSCSAYLSVLYFVFLIGLERSMDTDVIHRSGRRVSPYLLSFSSS